LWRVRLRSVTGGGRKLGRRGKDGMGAGGIDEKRGEHEKRGAERGGGIYSGFVRSQKRNQNLCAAESKRARRGRRELGEFGGLRVTFPGGGERKGQSGRNWEKNDYVRPFCRDQPKMSSKRSEKPCLFKQTGGL